MTSKWAQISLLFLPGIPILTSDERTGWAKNRKHLIELSKNNAEQLKIIESAAMTLCLDDNEPANYSDTALMALTGDYVKAKILFLFNFLMQVIITQNGSTNHRK